MHGSISCYWLASSSQQVAVLSGCPEESLPMTLYAQFTRCALKRILSSIQIVAPSFPRPGQYPTMQCFVPCHVLVIKSNRNRHFSNMSLIKWWWRRQAVPLTCYYNSTVVVCLHKTFLRVRVLKDRLWCAKYNPNKVSEVIRKQKTFCTVECFRLRSIGRQTTKKLSFEEYEVKIKDRKHSGRHSITLNIPHLAFCVPPFLSLGFKMVHIKTFKEFFSTKVKRIT